MKAFIATRRLHGNGEYGEYGDEGVRSEGVRSGTPAVMGSIDLGNNAVMSLMFIDFVLRTLLGCCM